MARPTLIKLHPNEHSQEFHYHSSAVKLDRCVGSCNTINDLSIKVIFNMITGINESIILTKHVSCECKCKLDRTKYNSNQWWITINVDVSVKSIIYVKKICLES